MGKMLTELRNHLSSLPIETSEQIKKVLEKYGEEEDLTIYLNRFEELIAKSIDEKRAKIFVDWLNEGTRLQDHIDMVKNVIKFLENEEMRKNMFDIYVTKLDIIVIEYKNSSHSSFMKTLSVEFYNNNVQMIGEIGLENKEANNNFHNITKEFLK